MTLEAETWPVPVKLRVKLPMPTSLEEVASLRDAVAAHFDESAQAANQERLESAVCGLFSTYEGVLRPSEYMELRRALRTALVRGITSYELRIPEGLQRTFKKATTRLLDRVDEQRAQDLLQLRDYPQTFPLARSLGRRLHLKLGPTNSGKTYQALSALKAARSGVYLAPLRLLAMEVRDQLMAEGIPCNLLTGEEHEIVPGAEHTACTIEMLNPDREVEVAVIDEIQMLGDPQRGWAWTAALLGAPAREVFVCGSEVAEEAVRRVLEHVGEAYDVELVERKTSLELETRPLRHGIVREKAKPAQTKRRRKGKRFRDPKKPKWVTAAERREDGAGKESRRLMPGDAVIAFSRRDVLTLSARIRKQGFSVATIYGALAPEVRRREANRFASGEAQVVVATDAIGMGLNLPIRRVIFSTTHKFDGRHTRRLNAAEVQQIAGRAGRFGLYPEGFVTATNESDIAHLRRCLNETVAPLPERLSVGPSLRDIRALAEILRTENIASLLSFYARRLHGEDELFQTADLEDNIALAHIVDRVAPNMRLADKFTFACAPVSRDNLGELNFFRSCVETYMSGRSMPMPSIDKRLRRLKETDGTAFLEPAEQLSKDLTVYAWLSFKFPETFNETEELPKLRQELGARIERALLHQNGFGQTSKEAFEERQQLYVHFGTDADAVFDKDLRRLLGL